MSLRCIYWNIEQSQGISNAKIRIDFPEMGLETTAVRLKVWVYICLVKSNEINPSPPNDGSMHALDNTGHISTYKN